MKVLIIRAGRTGDMVMLTPALKALLNKYPEAEFMFLTSPDGKRTLGDFSPRITRFWIYNREKVFSFLSRGTIQKKIAEAQFDHVYCFEHNPSFQRLLADSKAEIHGFWEGMGQKHYCQLLLDVVLNGAENINKDIYVSLSVSNQAKNETTQTLAALGITEKTFLLAMHPTFSGAQKRFRTTGDKKNKLWPPESFALLAQRLKEYAKKTDIDLRILMNLMPDECTYGEKIIQLAGESLEIFSPRPNFQNYKAFLNRVDLLLTPDTGPMHIASAVGTRLIALFSGRDPRNCGPFTPLEQSQVFRAEETNHPELGIAAIPVHDVYNACIKIIG
ncbi:hypothetical protein MNBD_NITROSPIRAE01-672 [hydrothermal vent metagenome]|uniref:ADP-heptose--lipooligosaccharide heptosyltransferase II n=1 Tax=hydrothermal vent metagenome TaxID=652676 RepID=A0A3B1DF80_9ZZZZ